VDSDTHGIFNKYKLVNEAFSVTPGGNAGGGNGRLQLSQLREVEPGHYLHPYVADKFTQMKQDAARQGINLDINNAYRSYDKQVEMANRLGLYSRGGKAAVPGTSNHGWGTAVDLNVRSNPGAFQWLQQNGVRYGFNNIAREPWHWEIKPNRVPGLNTSSSAQPAGPSSQQPPSPSNQQFPGTQQTPGVQQPQLMQPQPFQSQQMGGMAGMYPGLQPLQQMIGAFMPRQQFGQMIPQNVPQGLGVQRAFASQFTGAPGSTLQTSAPAPRTRQFATGRMGGKPSWASK